MQHELPLTDLAFNVLVALADDEVHGYALVKRLQELEGRKKLRTGTVYAALARLQQQGWVEETTAESGEGADARRRYYRITPVGVGVARAEAARLASVLDRARAKHLLPDPARG